jgi:hypothetical protein
MQNGELSIDYSKKDHEVWHELLSVYTPKLSTDLKTLLSFASLTLSILHFRIDRHPRVAWMCLSDKLFPARAKYLDEILEIGTPIRFEDEYVLTVSYGVIHRIKGTWLDHYLVTGHAEQVSAAASTHWNSECTGIDSARSRLFLVTNCSTWRFSSIQSYAEIYPNTNRPSGVAIQLLGVSHNVPVSVLPNCFNNGKCGSLR